MSDRPAVVIPDRPSFKASEVCELLGIQPYVLRTWENEFKDLGVAKAAGAPRVYRRRDVELALRIKALVFTDGLTLAGARRRLEQERAIEPPAAAGEDEVVSEAASSEIARAMRERLATIRHGLQEILAVLAKSPGGPGAGAVRSDPRSSPAAPGSLVSGAAASASPRTASVAAVADRDEPDAAEFQLVPGEEPGPRRPGARTGGEGGTAEGSRRRTRGSPPAHPARRAT
jgi:DNA-binding transcriptional MerR regulator